MATNLMFNVSYMIDCQNNELNGDLGMRNAKTVTNNLPMSVLGTVMYCIVLKDL